MVDLLLVELLQPHLITFVMLLSPLLLLLEFSTFEGMFSLFCGSVVAAVDETGEVLAELEDLG